MGLGQRPGRPATRCRAAWVCDLAADGSRLQAEDSGAWLWCAADDMVIDAVRKVGEGLGEPWEHEEGPIAGLRSDQHPPPPPPTPAAPLPLVPCPQMGRRPHPASAFGIAPARR